MLLAQLEKLRGTDASWKDDIEPPPEVQEFSDDEKEREVKKKGKKRKVRGALEVKFISKFVSNLFTCLHFLSSSCWRN